MQTSYPSDHVGNPVTGRRIIFALGMAIVVAVTLVVTRRVDSVRTTVSAPATAVQPLENVGIAFVEHETEVRSQAASSAQPNQRPSKIVPEFDNVARAELQRKVQKSINASLLRLGDDLAGNGID